MHNIAFYACITSNGHYDRHHPKCRCALLSNRFASSSSLILMYKCRPLLSNSMFIFIPELALCRLIIVFCSRIVVGHTFTLSLSLPLSFRRTHKMHNNHLQRQRHLMLLCCLLLRAFSYSHIMWNRENTRWMGDGDVEMLWWAFLDTLNTEGSNWTAPSQLPLTSTKLSFSHFSAFICDGFISIKLCTPFGLLDNV